MRGMIRKLSVFHWRRSSLFKAVLFFLTVFVASAATNEVASDIFAPSAPALRLKVEISRQNMRSLQGEPRKPVPAIAREGDMVYTDVMVHVKGAAGSFRDISSNPSLTLSFGKLEQDQRFQGLHKIHRNNSV